MTTAEGEECMAKGEARAKGKAMGKTLGKTMAKSKDGELETLAKIKRLAVAAMFSDDDLMDELVLKGGNAMALIHKLTSRQSIDLDFSMARDFEGGVEGVQAKIVRALQQTFRAAGYEPFDLKMAEKPAQVSPELAGFWGGYDLEFKLAPTEQYEALKQDMDKLRKSALNIGQGTKFSIDISRFEYVEDKEPAEVDGYRIFVYSPTMIACEKLRAICQQMEVYGPVVKRSRPGAPRARDFIDIYVLVEELGLTLTQARALQITREMFKVKHVELAWLADIGKEREFHRQNFEAVRQTRATSYDLKDFDFYFDYVVKLANEVWAAMTR
ncbi:nucleotidyl transferase AbiEii/AbiGii toxin family protein [Paucibacter sp. O1-1]|nr:nucleotidyl transferase AbiEii/AbiGii toxin family protein [Paucibacter sp. O1-1]MDA3831177.1 nucleotidyl transferase AbiEii/AbiGii toxin family protein [Paucibacter sp. O1-1]